MALLMSVAFAITIHSRVAREDTRVTREEAFAVAVAVREEACTAALAAFAVAVAAVAEIICSSFFSCSIMLSFLGVLVGTVAFAFIAWMLGARGGVCHQGKLASASG